MDVDLSKDEPKCVSVDVQAEMNKERITRETQRILHLSNEKASSICSNDVSESKENVVNGIYVRKNKENVGNEVTKRIKQPCEVNAADLNKLNKHEFVKLQRKLLYLERDMENERELMKTVNKNGEGIPGVLPHLELVSNMATEFGRYCITFASYAHRTLPSHGLKKGDNVSIYKGGPLCRPEDHCREGVVIEVSSQDINITIDEPYEFEESSSYSVKHYPSLENIHRILKSLHQICDVQGPAFHLCAVLFNEEPPMFPLPRLHPKLCALNTDELVFFDKKLDTSQREAVEFVVKQQDLAVVHGPPGTGKTTTLIEIIRQHVKMGIKVLALAPSNLGVDNLVERLDVAGLRVVRIGHPARSTPATQRHTIDALMHRNEDREVVDDIQKEICSLTKKLEFIRGRDRKGIYKELGQLRKELNGRQDKMFRQLVKGADVVLCTLLSAHANGALRCLDKDHFGLTVIDECSQGTEASCYLCILRSPKLVLAGDHKQLPPTVLCSDASKLLVSLMERVIDLYGSQVVRMLTVQYRMHSDIMSWASAEMYENRLVAHQSVAAHLLCDLPHVASSEYTDVPLLLVDTSSCPGFEESDDAEKTSVVSRSNEGEASLVLALVKKLISAGLEQHQLAVITPYSMQVSSGQHQLAVITPYSMQVKLVRSLVHEDFPDVEVQTVDGFQGREKEAVILTLVRSNVKGEIGFLSEDRRLNVAVTRARRHLSVVCDTRTLEQHQFLKNFVQYMSERARVVRAEHIDEENCTQISADFRDLDLSGILKEPRKNVGKSEPKSEEQIAKEEQERTQNKLDRYKKVLDNFVQSSRIKHHFPAKLSSYDRMLIHDIAESLGLHHFSEGLEKKRHIVVSKEPISSAVDNDSVQGTGAELLVPDENNSEAPFSSTDDTQVSNIQSPSECSASVKPVSELCTICKTHIRGEDFTHHKLSCQAKTKAATSREEGSTSLERAIKHCTICGKDIAKENFTSHRLGCERIEREAIARQKQDAKEKKVEAQLKAGQESVKSKKKKSQLNAKGKDNVDGGLKSTTDGNDSDDFDAVVSSFAASHNRCNVAGCSAGCTLLLQSCSFCHTYYCLQHFVAEAHGCGQHARQHGRATVVREGVVYPGSGVPSKLPSRERRAQLQRKLDKKISTLENSRKQQHKKK
ncbi:R3H domain [Trinorchestia longiramus]|nr:R3H domain [Trinorchestia longiramus]